MQKLSDESWVKLPLKLLKAHGLSKGAATICCCIIDICGKAGLEQYTAISTSELAAATGYAVKTAKRAVLELEALGLIEIRRSTGSVSSYKLTGCVELCPAVFKHPEQPARNPASRARKRPEPTPEEVAEMNEYLSLANRFKDVEEPLPGQTSFF